MTKTQTPFTGNQLRAGYTRNLAQLRVMLEKAERTGKKVNGFTADQLRERVAEFQRLSVASDADLRAHLTRRAS